MSREEHRPQEKSLRQYGGAVHDPQARRAEDALPCQQARSGDASLPDRGQGLQQQQRGPYAGQCESCAGQLT